MGILRSVLFLVLLITGSSALAGPVVDQLFSLRQQNSANSNNFATGDILFWGANSVPGGETLWSVTRQCPAGGACVAGPPPSGPGLVGQATFYRSFTISTARDQYFASRPYRADLTGPWTFLVSTEPAQLVFGATLDPAKTTVVNTPAVGSAGVMPYVPSMTVTGAGLTPSISWTLPSAAELAAAGVDIDRVRISVTDNTPGFRVTATSRSPFFANSFEQGDVISFGVVASGAAVGTTTSFTIPSGVLTTGHQYSIGILLEDARADGTTQTRSQSFFDFAPLSGPIADSVYLPTTVPVSTTSGLTAGPLYEFTKVPASPDAVTFIDPVVATGFEYHTAGEPDPNFRTVRIVTNVGDGIYEVWRWGGLAWILADAALAVDEVFDFGAAGVDQFQIRGIETSAGLSPFSITAFVTGLTFVSAGTFNGTMQALVAEVAFIPEPPMLLLMLAALGLIGWSRRHNA